MPGVPSRVGNEYRSRTLAKLAQAQRIGLELVCAGVGCAGACLSFAVGGGRVLGAAGVDGR